MEHKFIRSENNPGAIVNTDATGLQAYKMRKAKMEEQKNKIDKMETELSEIKTLLKQLLLKDNK